MRTHNVPDPTGSHNRPRLPPAPHGRPSSLPPPRPSHSRTPRRPGSAAAPASARLSRMTRDWGRAVHSACAASSRLGRALCPRRPHPRPGGKRGAVGHLRSHEPARVRHPTPILCRRRAVGSAGRLEQGWARATRPSAPQQTGHPASEARRRPLPRRTRRHSAPASVAVLESPLMLIWFAVLVRAYRAVRLLPRFSSPSPPRLP